MTQLDCRMEQAFKSFSDWFIAIDLLHFSLEYVKLLKYFCFLVYANWRKTFLQQEYDAPVVREYGLFASISQVLLRVNYLAELLHQEGDQVK